MTQKTKARSRPVGRPRADGRSHLTRLDVFRATAKLMSVFGYSGTSIRMLAEELDASTASIFNLFGSKKELFDELMTFVAQPAFQFYDALYDLELPAEQALFKSLHEECLVLNSAPVEFVALFQVPETRHPDFGHARNIRRKLVTHYERIVIAGIESGVFAETTPRWMADQIIMLVETCVLAGDQYPPASIPKRSLETTRFCMRGLLEDPERLPEIERACERIDLKHDLTREHEEVMAPQA